VTDQLPPIATAQSAAVSVFLPIGPVHVALVAGNRREFTEARRIIQLRPLKKATCRIDREVLIDRTCRAAVGRPKLARRRRWLSF
jgi:hypothetical protein